MLVFCGSASVSFESKRVPRVDIRERECSEAHLVRGCAPGWRHHSLNGVSFYGSFSWQLGSLAAPELANQRVLI